MPSPRKIIIMLDTYLIIFQTIIIQLVPLIVPVFGVYLIITLISNLLFDKR